MEIMDIAMFVMTLFSSPLWKMMKKTMRMRMKDAMAYFLCVKNFSFSSNLLLMIELIMMSIIIGAINESDNVKVKIFVNESNILFDSHAPSGAMINMATNHKNIECSIKGTRNGLNNFFSTKKSFS